MSIATLQSLCEFKNRLEKSEKDIKVIRRKLEKIERKILQQQLEDHHAPDNLELQVFDFHPEKKKSMMFLKVKNIQELSFQECRLWALEWKSAFGFAEFLFSLDHLKDFKILEIGAGSGLVGTVCAMQSAEVWITDRVESAIELTKKNLAINHVEATTQVMDWNKPSQYPTESFDFIFGSDVLYQGRNADPIAELMASNLLKPTGLGIVFCPGRGYAERLARISKESPSLNSELHILYDVNLKFCSMPELHVVIIYKQEDCLHQFIYLRLLQFLKDLGE